MILKISTLVAAITATAAMGDDPNAAAFMSSLDSVHASCDRDVSLMCTASIPFPTVRIISSHPMMNMGFTRIVSPSQNLDSALDELINSAMSMNPTIRRTEPSTTIDDVFDEMVQTFLGNLVSPPSSRSDSRSASADTPPPTDDDVSTPLLGSNGHGVWRFEDATSAIAAHGSKMLASEDTPSEQRRLARRLTAVSPDMVKPCLGYGCRVDRCLWHMKEVGSLSRQCDTAMSVARATFMAYQSAMEKPMARVERQTEQMKMTSDEEQAQAALIEDELELITVMTFFLGLFLFPITVFFFFKTVIGHKFRRSENRRLRLKILNAVYDNPAIKQSIQEAIEEDLGDEVPLPPCQRHTPSTPASTCDRLFFSLPLLSLALLLFYTSITSPEAVLMVGAPAISLMMLYIMGKHCCRLMCDCGRGAEEGSDFEREGRQPLLEGGNETGICLNCDGESVSNCGSCGCCVNCCGCAAVYEGAPLIVMM